MSKKLRLLLVPLLLMAPSLSLRAQEAEVTEEVEEVAVQEEPTDAEPSPDAAPEEPAAAAEPTAEPEAAEPAPDAAEPEPTPDEAPAEERSEGSVQWEPDAPSEQASEQPQDTPVTPKKYGEDEVMGLDTVDIATPQGNWLYKRVWWERAEAKYERIREAVNKIMEERTRFFAKRAELDKNVLDPFYIKIGISQGELQEILTDLLAKAEKLLESERSEPIQEKIEADKKALQDLQAQVQQVIAKDEEVDKAILMLVEQITKLRTIEQQAWQDFKSIARVLDDKKAREHFYKVDAAWRNIKELQNYLEQTFASRFDALVAKVGQEVQRVDQEMNAIKESGIDLKQRVLGAQRAQQEMEEEEEVEEPKGFFTRYITDPAKGLFNGIWAVVSWPYRAIFGGPSEQEADEDEREPETEEKEAVTQKEAQKPEEGEQAEEVAGQKQEGAVEDEPAPAAEEKEAVEQEEAAEEPKDFFTRYISDPAKGLFEGIWAAVSWPYRAIFGGPSEQEADEDEREPATEVAVQEQEEVKDEQEPAADEKETVVQEEVQVPEEGDQAEEGAVQQQEEPTDEVEGEDSEPEVETEEIEAPEAIDEGAEPEAIEGSE